MTLRHFGTQFFTIILTLLSVAAMPAKAGVVNGGVLLGNVDADQLETWLGVGDQDFTNIFSGTAGVATASDFHSAVDGVGSTFSIYSFRLADNSTARVGGYTTADWGGTTGYQSDSSAFIFNLDTSVLQATQSSPGHSIYRSTEYFSTFGGGHDIYGGRNVLGTYFGSSLGNPWTTNSGYTNNHSYNQGGLNIAGTNHYNGMFVESLEVYTIANAASVPAPASLALFGLSLILLGFKKREVI